MEMNIGMSECHKNVDNHYGSTITVWIPRCAGREAFDGVEPLPEYFPKKTTKVSRGKIKPLTFLLLDMRPG